MHEAQLHQHNSFITLTYDDKHLPENNSLRYTDYQKFMKRLRKQFNVRYYMCGEYGEETYRPHYHACLFGTAFEKDRYPWKKTSAGYQLYRSPTLEKLWKFGTSNIGDLTFDSANYVAGYIQKKLTGDGETKYYNIFDPETGEIHIREKEFGHMSQSLGRDWLRMYWQEAKEGKVIANGREVNIPRAYRKYFKNTQDYDELIHKLGENIKPEDQTDERLAVRQQVAIARTQLSKRNRHD